MAVYVSEVIKVAESEVGYLEKASNSLLDDKTANAGDKNYTKYARDLLAWIGQPFSQGQPWCAMFLCWCFIASYGKIKSMELLNGWTAYTPTMAQHFKNIGAWIDRSGKPQAGDIVFYKNDVRICHVGLVYKVDATNIYTIEGNTSSGSNNVVSNGGGVFKKSYRLNHDRIAGYGRPKYDKEQAIPIDSINNYDFGVDISEYNGDIDFASVKRNGINFAILRTIKKDGTVDKNFEEYYENCVRHGIVPKVYKYSYARTEAEAIKEAQDVLKLLGNRRLEIWYDLENTEQLHAIGYAGIELVATRFLSTCVNAGCPVGIYCNLDWYKNYISSGLKKLCRFWIARHGKNDGKLDMQYKPNVGEVGWQFTSTAKIAGIKGDVDLNIMNKVR